jgi:hypothetical protein
MCSIWFLGTGRLAFRNVVGVASNVFKCSALHDPERFPAPCFPPASPKVGSKDPCSRGNPKILNLKEFMVGGRGIEPLTPSMSRKCSSAELEVF